MTRENPPRTKTDRFADLLASGHTVRSASEQLEIDSQDGNAILQRLRRKFGQQAR